MRYCYTVYWWRTSYVEKFDIDRGSSIVFSPCWVFVDIKKGSTHLQGFAFTTSLLHIHAMRLVCSKVRSPLSAEGIRRFASCHSHGKNSFVSIKHFHGAINWMKRRRRREDVKLSSCSCSTLREGVNFINFCCISAF